MARYSLTGPAGHLVVRGAQLDVDVVEAITDASLKLSTSEVTELSLTLEDRKLEALATGLFDPGTTAVPGARLDYAQLALEVRAMELSSEGALSVTARSWSVAQLKRPVTAKVTAGLSPSKWVEAEARACGLAAVTQPTPTAATVTLQQNETRWDTMQRLAKEIGYVCFESTGTVYFAKPSWLIGRPGARTLNIALGPDRQPIDGRVLARPSLRRSSDAPTKVAELVVDLLPELGQEFVPGDVLNLTGIPIYSGKYLIDSVDIDLADKGLVSVAASTPVDPTPEPPQAAGSAGSYGAAGMSGLSSPGAGTYCKVRLDAEQVAGATKIVQAGNVVSGVNDDALVIALMVAYVEARFRSPDEAHSDRDSAGPFQQRRAWERSEATRRDYAAATKMFLTGGKGGQRGLLDVKNWRSRPKGVVAQVVQGSAFPSRYAPMECMATALLKAIKATARPIGTGGTVAAGGAGGSRLEQFVQLALQQAGKQYRQTRSISYGRGSHPSVFDCSSLVYWAAVNAGYPLPTSGNVPLNTYSQSAYATAHHLWIPLERGIRTRGAILWNGHHTAISLGNGRTIEAMGTKWGVLQGRATGRFERAWMLPGP